MKTIFLLLLFPVFTYGISLRVEFKLQKDPDYENLSHMLIKLVSSEEFNIKTTTYFGQQNKYPEKKYCVFNFREDGKKVGLSIDKNNKELRDFKFLLAFLFKKSFNEVNLEEERIWGFNELAVHIEDQFIFEGFEVTHRELSQDYDSKVSKYRKILYLKK